MNKPFVVISSPVTTRSGYGEHSRDIIKSLIEAYPEWDIKLIAMPWGATPPTALDSTDTIFVPRIISPQLQRQPDIFIQITIPNEFQPIGKFNIGITAGIETTLAHSSWIEGINRMNLVIVPSNFAKETFTNSIWKKMNQQTNQYMGDLAVTTPIEVLFEGVDTNIYKKINKFIDPLSHKLNTIPEEFCFLTVGHWLSGELGHDRKDIGMTIKTFLSAFATHNDKKTPALILKSSGASFSIIDRDQILGKIYDIKNIVYKELGNNIKLPSVYLLHGDLTNDEMNILYNHPKINAMYSLTKGEGYGRPLAEFSVTGKPIIVSNWSGHLDFINSRGCQLVPGELTPIHPSAQWKDVILSESKWFTANYEFAKTKLIDVYEQYGQYLNRARMQRNNIENFTLEKMQIELKQLLDKYVPKIPTITQLKLPKLKPIALPNLNKDTTNEEN